MDKLTDEFVSYASSVLGDTNKGLSANRIIKICSKYALKYGRSIPYTSKPRLIRKDEVLRENISAFDTDEQIDLLMELCNEYQVNDKAEVKGLLKMVEDQRSLIEKYEDSCITDEVESIVEVDEEANDSNRVPLNEYFRILKRIDDTLKSFEETPKSYFDMNEEQLRNVLLASLNSHYNGQVSGEKYRNKGKTDLCLVMNNRSAFVAECKIWKGVKMFGAAINQLDGYLTRRDDKAALIIFVKNKRFNDVLDKVREALNSNSSFNKISNVEDKILDVSYASKVKNDSIIRIRIMLYDIYYDVK